MITDWRITNLASSTFWPKCGFKPVAYRMVRYINSNIAWANFNNPSIKVVVANSVRYFFILTNRKMMRSVTHRKVKSMEERIISD